MRLITPSIELLPSLWLDEEPYLCFSRKCHTKLHQARLAPTVESSSHQLCGCICTPSTSPDYNGTHSQLRRLYYRMACRPTDRSRSCFGHARQPTRRAVRIGPRRRLYIYGGGD